MNAARMPLENAVQDSVFYLLVAANRLIWKADGPPAALPVKRIAATLSV